MYIMRNLKPTYKSLRSSAVAERPREHAVVVVVVNAQSARTVASLSSDRDQWLASTESQWEHCFHRGGVVRSIWYVVDLVDVFMLGLGVDRPIARLGVAWPGVLECYPAILPYVRIWHCDLW